MVRIIIMIVSLWILEAVLINDSNKEKIPLSISWIVGVTIINSLETAYLIISEIFG